MLVPNAPLTRAEAWGGLPDGATDHVTLIPHRAEPYGNLRIEPGRTSTSVHVLALESNELLAVRLYG
jgi:hypothetical protein